MRAPCSTGRPTTRQRATPGTARGAPQSRTWPPAMPQSSAEPRGRSGTRGIGKPCMTRHYSSIAPNYPIRRLDDEADHDQQHSVQHSVPVRGAQHRNSAHLPNLPYCLIEPLRRYHQQNVTAMQDAELQDECPMSPTVNPHVTRPAHDHDQACQACQTATHTRDEERGHSRACGPCIHTQPSHAVMPDEFPISAGLAHSTQHRIRHHDQQHSARPTCTRGVVQ